MSDAQSIKGLIGGIACILGAVFVLWGVGWESTKYLLMIAGSLAAVGVAATGVRWLRNRNVLRRLDSWVVGVPSGSSHLETSELLGKIEHADLKNVTEVFPLLDALCDDYLVQGEENRNRLRDFFAEQHSRQLILLEYAHLSARKLKIRRREKDLEASERGTILRRGLAAVSTNNLQTDWRECQQALNALFKSAVAASLDPAAYFDEIRDLSSEVSPHPQISDHPSMRRFLREVLEQFQKEST
ncbi:MAG: hypothetical protein AAF657_09520 [Acidobacteriota bacterium]